MKRLPLEKLGAHELPGNVVKFGVFLPWVSADQGNRLWVKVIHEKDQFIQEIPPHLFEMVHSPDPDYGDYWSAEVDISATSKPHLASAWGTPGRYVYRYFLTRPKPDQPHELQEIDWIIDPFAREFGVGKLSAFTLGYEPHEWSTQEKDWKTPALSDLVMYELMISEFGGDIERTIAQLDYLKDLGVNCLEIMPISNVSNTVDWGFLPIGYFGVDERFGKRKDLQKLIDAAHQRGLAVIVDSVYGHTSDHFPYSYLYRELHYHENPCKHVTCDTLINSLLQIDPNYLAPPPANANVVIKWSAGKSWCAKDGPDKQEYSVGSRSELVVEGTIFGVVIGADGDVIKVAEGSVIVVVAGIPTLFRCDS